MSAATEGPAFPVGDAANWQFHGMSLRAYFAAAADIPWEVAADIVYRQNGNQNGTVQQIMAKRVDLAAQQADMMVKEFSA